MAAAQKCNEVFLPKSDRVSRSLPVAQLGYILAKVHMENSPATWNSDCDEVTLIISRVLDDAKLEYIRAYGDEAYRVWQYLGLVQEDKSEDGRMHCLRRLVLMEMGGNMVEGHIKTTPKCLQRPNPLEKDYIHATVLLVSLKSDWLRVITPLIRQNFAIFSKVVQDSKIESAGHSSLISPFVSDASAPKAEVTYLPKDGEIRDRRRCTFRRAGQYSEGLGREAIFLMKHKKEETQKDLRNSHDKFTKRKFFPGTLKSYLYTAFIMMQAVSPCALDPSCSSNSALVQFIRGVKCNQVTGGRGSSTTRCTTVIRRDNCERCDACGTTRVVSQGTRMSCLTHTSNGHMK